MDKKAVIKKIGKITINILMYVFILLGLFSVAMSLVAKRGDDGAATVFGYQLRFVLSDSMGKSSETDVSKYEIGSIPIKSLIFVEVKPENEKELDAWYKSLKKGDVLTFRYVLVKQKTVTHRIVDIKEYEHGGYRIELQGDNKADDAESTTQVIYTNPDVAPDNVKDDAIYNFVIGKVVGHSELLGNIAYALKSKVGIVCFIIVPCLIIIVLEIIKIVSVLGEDKKRKAEELNAAQNDKIEAQETELATLKKELEALKKARAVTQETPEQKTVETSDTTVDEIDNKSEGE